MTGWRIADTPEPVEWDYHAGPDGFVIVIIRKLFLGPGKTVCYRVVTNASDRAKRQLVGYFPTYEAAHQGARDYSMAIAEWHRHVAGRYRSNARDYTPEPDPHELLKTYRQAQRHRVGS